MKKGHLASSTSANGVSIPGKAGELTDTIKIDFASIPDYVRDDIAAATLDSVKAFLREKRKEGVMA